MNRFKFLSAVILASLVPTASLASAQALDASAHSASAPTVQLRRTHLGTILVNGSGRTLYVFTRDRPKSDSCLAIKECPEAWPALMTRSAPRGGPGVSHSLLSWITVKGGKQVTYAGHALYLYSGDSGPGETEYVGARQFGGSWDALNASAHLLH